MDYKIENERLIALDYDGAVYLQKCLEKLKKEKKIPDDRTYLTLDDFEIKKATACEIPEFDYQITIYKDRKTF